MKEEICSIEGCKKEIKYGSARGFCSMHYSRWRRHGDPIKGTRAHGKYDPICKVKGCEKKHSSKGYCHKHYQLWYTHGTPITHNKSLFTKRLHFEYE